ncbi:MAG: TetR/AcrR family transcriptional regulator [Gemmatimonadales bacterium]|nr:TetR/AcrR family transcriptional regulator [Gemmatimonadales bacterium]
MPQERDRSRTRIEDAAREEFKLHGYHGARIARIATRSGLNKQLIYYYFGSKRELHEHTLRQSADRVRIEPTFRRTLGGTPAERLRSLLEITLKRVASAPELARALVRGEGDSPGAASASSVMADLAHEIGREISRGQGLGYYRDDLDPGLLGRQAVALLVGWGSLEGASGDQVDPDITGWADATADLLSRALSW